MQILVLFAHPRLSASIIQKAMLSAIADLDGITVHDLYAAYPDFDIDIRREQALLLDHDLIVFQHPLYWYSSPSIIKEWLDMVLQQGWAYGRNGDKLSGKVMMQALSTGYMYEADGSDQQDSLHKILLPFRQTAQFCGMAWLAPFSISSSVGANPLLLQEKSEEYRNILIGLRDGRLTPQDLTPSTA